MSATDDVRTLGRSRLSFATQADLDEFVETLDAFENGRLGPGPVAGVPPGARPVRPAAGRPAHDPREDPAGHPQRRAARRAGRVAERYSRGFGHITTRQNIQFHFVQLHDAERAFERLAADGPDDARGVRQLGAQHHRVPVRRDRGRRGVRRHAVRRGADALLPAPSAVGVAAAQVQDRLRRLRRGPRLHRHQRHRLARRGAAGRRPARAGLPRARRRRHRDDVAGRRRCCSTSCRLARCSTSPRRSCACSIAWATTSTSTRTG